MFSSNSSNAGRAVDGGYMRKSGICPHKKENQGLFAVPNNTKSKNIPAGQMSKIYLKSLNLGFLIYTLRNDLMKRLPFIFLLLQGFSLFAQLRYKPTELFPALPIYPQGTSYRTATGEPGPAYWQNKVDYLIDVALDDRHDIVSGTATITYTNNSPKPVSFLWMQLDQNVYKKHSRGLDAKLFLDTKSERTDENGFKIASIKNSTQKTLDYLINDTRMRVNLDTPLAPGQKLTFSVQYSYQLPRQFQNADFNVNRTDIMPAKAGDVYSIAQWYPRLCVLDDVEGWNTLPYLGNGEFYLEFGDFQVNITLPSAYIVEASGDLLNPQEVLTPTAATRLKNALQSEKSIFIRTAQEVSDPKSRPEKASCTWKFKMNNTRDFAWTASKSFVWEGIGITLPSGKKVLGSSLYPAEFQKPDSWLRSSEYVKFTLQYFSKKWFEYPFSKAVNVASNLEGMEYPGIVFCSAKDTGNMYWAVVNHELGHTWFPMVVGSNERKYAWMDEGFNTFMDNMASKDFNQGEFQGYPAIDVPVQALFADSLKPIVTRPDATPGNLVYTLQYQKVAYLLNLLREKILGSQRFDAAFQKYIRDWAYKHPTPWDFFKSINNTSGEDLTWFWKAMFLENYKLDQKVKQVIAGTNLPTTILFENMETAAMPLDLEITYEGGARERLFLPVEIWHFSHEYALKLNNTRKVTRVVIDPENIFPDVATANNIWDAGR